MTPLGFEPTQFALVKLESAPLDRSGKLSTAGMAKIVVKTSRADFSFKTNETEHACLDQPAVAAQSGSQRDADKKAEENVQRRERKRSSRKDGAETAGEGNSRAGPAATWKLEPYDACGIWAHTSATWVHPLRPLGQSANCWHDQNYGPNIWGWFFRQNQRNRARLLGSTRRRRTKWKPVRRRQKGWGKRPKKRKKKKQQKRWHRNSRRRKQPGWAGCNLKARGYFLSIS